MKNSTKLFPIPAGFKMRIQHIHDPAALQMLFGKNPPKYYTEACLYGPDDIKPTARGEAFCNRKDNPSRKLGRLIAHNRAMLDYANRSNDKAASKVVAA